MSLCVRVPARSWTFHVFTKTGAKVTYKDQSYYQEYRDLLEKLRMQLKKLKAENEDCLRENRTLTMKLREVRSQLAGAQQEAEKLRQLLDKERSGRSDQIAEPENTGAGVSLASGEQSSSVSPSLFDDMSDPQKIALRQQVNELISRIDYHLARSDSNE